MERPRIEIAIYISNEQYAIRFWPAVPRVGDEVMVRRVKDATEVDEHAIAIVKDVCWGTSDWSRCSPWDELRVSLFCEWRD